MALVDVVEAASGEGAGRPDGAAEVPLTSALAALADELGGLAARFDPALVDGAAAERLVAVLDRVVRVASGFQARAAARAAECGRWKLAGHRSAEEWLAKGTGVPTGRARELLDVGERLESAPPTLVDAVAEGRLSAPQAAEVARAAEVAPERAGELIDLAERESLRRLAEECRRVTAAAEDGAAVEREAFRRRALRERPSADGTSKIDVGLPVIEAAELRSALAPFRDAVFAQAGADGRRDGWAAYDADALLAMARAAGDPSLSPSAAVAALQAARAARGWCDAPGPVASRRRTRGERVREGSAAGSDVSGEGGCRCGGRRREVLVRVDAAALVRGSLESGEVCEVPGVGPVSIASAKAALVDVPVRILAAHGVDARSLTSASRRWSSMLLAALDEGSGGRCEVPGCDATALDTDHEVPWSEGGPTTVANGDRLCRHHHRLKTHRGFRLLGPPERRRWVGPGGRPPDGDEAGAPGREPPTLL